jgi:chromosome partitioning protein
MKTIVITSQKGGSGKTTLAASLSVAAERAKNGPVVIIDTDPQNTLATWWNARDAETPQLAQVTLRELPQKIADLAAAGFAYCFIDTPPALTEQSRQVLKLADLVLIPTRPSPNDLWSLGATLDLVKQANAPFVFVLTQAKANARLTIQTVAALSDHGPVLQAVVHDRVDYAASMTDGRTVLEINPSGAAALETEALWLLVRKKAGELAKTSELANTQRRVKAHA